MGITFYESDLEVVLIAHNNLVVITTTIREFKINQLLIDEGSSLSLLT